MTDYAPSAAPILFGQLADEMDINRLRRVADIEMDVDVGIVFAGEVEDPPDLAVRIGVVAWRAADCSCAALETLHQ